MIPLVTPAFVSQTRFMGTVTAITAGSSCVIIDAVTPIISTTSPQFREAARTVIATRKMTKTLPTVM